MPVDPRLQDLEPSSGAMLSQKEAQALPDGMILWSKPDLLREGPSILRVSRSAGPATFALLHDGCWGTPLVRGEIPLWLPRLPRLSDHACQTQIRRRSKTVTRRLRMPQWLGLAVASEIRWDEGAGPLMLLTDRSRPSPGRRKEYGERAQGLAVVELISAWMEPLWAINGSGECVSFAEVEREGFPWGPTEFVRLFCQQHRCEPTVDVARLEWRYL